MKDAVPEVSSYPTVRGSAPSATPLEPESRAHLLGAENAHIHRLEDLDRSLDEDAVGRLLAAAQVQVVLEADPV
jgi:hypothetical protein